MQFSGINFCRIVLVLAAVLLAGAAVAEHHEDAEAVKQAVLNYVNAIYEVKPKLIDESVHEKVQKVGYAPKKEGAGYREMWMTFTDLRELTEHWNKDGHMDPTNARRDIEILELLDQTAAVKLEAEWGIDFIHLAKDGKKWMIMNVIWQTYPAE